MVRYIMKLVITCICSMVLLSASFAAAKSKIPAPSKEYSIVLLGDEMSDDIDFLEEDTITHRLTDYLQRNVDKDDVTEEGIHLHNLSFEGASITTALGQLEEIKEYKPDIVVIQLGRNDALQAIEIHILERALANLIIEMRRLKAYPVVIGDEPPKEVPYTYASHYNVMVRRVANKYRALFLPKYENILRNKREVFLADGVTPNEEGKKILVKALGPTITDMITQIRRSRVKGYEALVNREREMEEVERKRRLQARVEASKERDRLRRLERVQQLAPRATTVAPTPAEAPTQETP